MPQQNSGTKNPRLQLPRNFVELPEFGYDASGWPKRILSRADKSVMAFVPAGVFMQGKEGVDENLGPQFSAYLGPYYIDEHEVTLENFNKFRAEVSAKGDRPPEEPINYGKEHYLSKLKDSQKSRVQILNANVLDKDLPKADIVQAQNFSYFIFKKREQLREYFKNACRGLKKDGIFVVDCFGGSECMGPSEEETEHKGFSYFWDQDSYDPVTNEAQFYIHFKRKGEKKREKVFSYDWRMWSIPEVREIMAEAGFKETAVYWEGTDEDGEGERPRERRAARRHLVRQPTNALLLLEVRERKGGEAAVAQPFRRPLRTANVAVCPPRAAGICNAHSPAALARACMRARSSGAMFSCAS